MKLDFRNYRKNEIEKKLDVAGFYPLDVMVTGITGAGKSTTLNNLFGRNIAKVGTGVEPETMNISSYNLNKLFRLWDTSGLGDSTTKDQRHISNLKKLLSQKYNYNGNFYGLIDIVLVIIDASNRDMGTTYKLLNNVIVPNIEKDRILVIMNQADLAMKGRHWNSKTCNPDDILLSFLEDKSISIKKRIEKDTGININKPIYYSAEYNYNTDKVFDLIINNIPKSRRKI